jgi:hypothetical protein
MPSHRSGKGLADPDQGGRGHDADDTYRGDEQANNEGQRFHDIPFVLANEHNQRTARMLADSRVSQHPCGVVPSGGPLHFAR